MLCGDDFDLKMNYIFRLFDFDSSDTLEKCEVYLTMQAVINGLCRITKTQLPTPEQV